MLVSERETVEGRLNLPDRGQLDPGSPSQSPFELHQPRGIFNRIGGLTPVPEDCRLQGVPRGSQTRCGRPRGYRIAAARRSATQPGHMVGNNPVAYRFRQGLLVAGRSRCGLVRGDVVLWKRIVNHRVGLLLVHRASRGKEAVTAAPAKGSDCENQRNALKEGSCLAAHGCESFRDWNGRWRGYEVVDGNAKRNLPGGISAGTGSNDALPLVDRDFPVTRSASLCEWGQIGSPTFGLRQTILSVG